MLSAALSPASPPIRVGQVIAFDGLSKVSDEWEWSLGTVREVSDRTAVIQEWGIHRGDIDTFKTILLKEIDSENERSRNYQDDLARAREKLASIRRKNEDDVLRVREKFDVARENIEAVDEVHLRRLTSQASPSPVAMAVLKGVMAIARADPSIDEYYSWSDTQLEYRKLNVMSDLSKVDIIAKMYPAAETLKHNLETDRRLSLAAATRDSPVAATLHEWITTALAYQEAYNNLTQDKRIQEQNDKIAEAIAGMKASREKMMKLKEELSRKNPSSGGGQITSFTRTSVTTTIPLSAVICPVSVDGTVDGCALTNDEVEQILSDSLPMRHQLKTQITHLRGTVTDSLADLYTLRSYTTELEERCGLQLHYLHNHLRDLHDQMSNQLANAAQTIDDLRSKDSDSATANAQLMDEVKRLMSDNAALATQLGENRTANGTLAHELEHQKAGNEKLADDLKAAVEALEKEKADNEKLAADLEDRERELAAHRQKRHDAKEARATDPELAEKDGVPLHSSRRTPRASSRGGRGAAAEDPASVPVDADVLATEPLFAVTMDEYADKRGALDALAADVEKLADELEQQKADNEKLAADLEDKERELAAHRQKRHDAKETRATDPELAEKDGVPLHSSRRTPRASSRGGRGAAAEDPASVPVDADVLATEPLFAVTMDEYDDKRGAADALAAENEKLADELEQQKAENEKLVADVAQHQGAVGDVADELEQQKADNEKLADELEQQKADNEKLADELEQQKADNEKLAADLEDKERELAAHRQKRHDAKEARATDPELAEKDGVPLHSSRRTPRASSRGGRGAAAEDPASVPVDADVLATEPLFAVTMDEYDDKRGAAEALASENAKLADELEQQKAENEKLVADVAQHQGAVGDVADELEQQKADNDKLTDELEQQKADNEKLADELEQQKADNEKLADELEQQKADNEKLVADVAQHQGAVGDVADELEQQKADNEKLADELEQQKADNEKLADELEQQKADNEKLAADLEDKERELAAHRQKRHDAKEARATDPELAEKDGVPLHSSRRTPRASSRGGRGAAAEDPASVPVDADVLATEPLFAVTMDEYDDKRGAAEALASENAKLADELEQQKAENEKLVADVAQHQGAVGDVADELEQQKADNDKLADELEQQKADNEKLADELEQQKADNDKLADELEQQKADNEKLADELEQQKADNDKLADELEQQKADNEKLADELEQQKADNDKLADELEQQKCRADEVELGNRALHDKIEELQDAGNTLNDGFNELLDEVKAHRRKRAAGKAARREDPELCAKDGCSADDVKGSRDGSINGGNGSAHGGVVNAGSDGADVSLPAGLIDGEPVYAVTMQEYAEKRDAGDELADELERQLAINEQLAGELDHEKENNDALNDALRAAEAAADRLQAELSNAENDLIEAQHDLQTKEEEEKSLKADLDDARRQEREAVAALDACGCELAEVKGCLQAASEDAAEKANELSRLQQALADKEKWDRAQVPNDSGAKVTHRFTKIFDGDWRKIIRERPEALQSAFIIDASIACNVTGDQVSGTAFDHD